MIVFAADSGLPEKGQTAHRRMAGAPFIRLVRTRLMNGAPAVIRWAVWPFSGSPESAAKTIVPLALDPEFADRSGQFFHHAKAIDPPKSTRDPDVARRLWDVAAELTGFE